MTKPLPAGDIVIGAGTLSDLFFNYDHEHRRALYDSIDIGQPTDEQVRGALVADADGFLDCLAGCVETEDRSALRDWLVADFEARV